MSLAIGKEGQNARLAYKLTGWRIDIKDPAALQEMDEELLRQARAAMADSQSDDFAWQGRQPRLVRADGTISVRDKTFGPLAPDLVGMSVDVDLGGDALEVFYNRDLRAPLRLRERRSTVARGRASGGRCGGRGGVTGERSGTAPATPKRKGPAPEARPAADVRRLPRARRQARAVPHRAHARKDRWSSIPTGKPNGRGAYLCDNRRLLGASARTRACLARALNVEIDPETLDRLRRYAATLPLETSTAAGTAPISARTEGEHR